MRFLVHTTLGAVDHDRILADHGISISLSRRGFGHDQFSNRLGRVMGKRVSARNISHIEQLGLIGERRQNGPCESAG